MQAASWPCRTTKSVNAPRRLVAAVLVVGAMTAACSGGGSTAGPSSTVSSSLTPGVSLKIGFITKFPVDFYDTMVDSVKTWAAGHPDVEVIFAQGKGGADDASEIAAIQSMVTAGVKAIAITPTSSNVEPALQVAVDQGVKVVLIDNDIPGWTGKSSLVATDNLAGGKLAGAFLLSKLKSGDKLAVLEGVVGNPSLEARITGMEQALGNTIQLVVTRSTNCDEALGQAAAQKILMSNPDIAGIYGACGPPIVGALAAVKAIGREGKLVIVGFDAAPGEIEAILAGTETASVAQFPAKMGSLGVQTALDAAMGQTVAVNLDTGTELVTKGNATKFS